jgi:ABC-type Zn uptake system ZnuABC Zn-binding protein ZnuA
MLLPAWALAMTLAPGALEVPRLAATIPPLAAVARELAGLDGRVVLLLPPGASPHTFEPTPGTAAALSGARVVFAAGYGLDDWSIGLARMAGVARVVRVDAGVKLLRAGGRVDPHYWLSAENGKRIARNIEKELERVLPVPRASLLDRLARLEARLDAADAEVRKTLATLPVRDIATFHDAFRYFADAYGLRVVAVFERWAGREPSAREVARFQSAIRRSGTRVLFGEPQSSLDPVRPIARDLGCSLSVLDEMGGTPGREDIAGLLLFDARQIAAGIGNGRS